MTDAMCAAAMACRACARGERFSNRTVNGGGGAVMEAHSGQSMLAAALSSPSSPVMSTIFMAPSAEQMICMLPGWIRVDAIAEPRNNANHTSTSLAMNVERRRVCMVRL